MTAYPTCGPSRIWLRTSEGRLPSAREVILLWRGDLTRAEIKALFPRRIDRDRLQTRLRASSGMLNPTYAPCTLRRCRLAGRSGCASEPTAPARVVLAKLLALRGLVVALPARKQIWAGGGRQICARSSWTFPTSDCRDHKNSERQALKPRALRPALQNLKAQPEAQNSFLTAASGNPAPAELPGHQRDAEHAGDVRTRDACALLDMCHKRQDRSMRLLARGAQMRLARKHGSAHACPQSKGTRHPTESNQTRKCCSVHPVDPHVNAA